MSNTSITYLVAAFSGVCGLAAYIAFVLVPAWTAYSRVWERCAAAFLTFYTYSKIIDSSSSNMLIPRNWDRARSTGDGRLHRWRVLRQPGTGRMGMGGAAGPVRQWCEGADDEPAHGDYGRARSSEGPRWPS